MADIIIPISGIIGIEVEPKDIREALNDAKGKDVIFDISSPGGFVMPALEIFNLIRLHDGKTTARLMGQAASAAAFIPMAADRIEAFDNAILMIHNVLALVIGNRNDLRDVADHFEKLDNLLAKAFIDKTGKSREEILKLMDEETFLFGDEIEKEGFADATIETEEDKDKETAIAVTREAISNCATQMKAADQAKDDLSKAAALADNLESVVNRSKVQKHVDNQKEDKEVKAKTKKEEIMDLKELRADHGTTFDEVVNVGVKQERDRILAHLKMGEASGDMKTAITAINDGSDMSQELSATYLAAGMKKKDVENRDGDDKDTKDAVDGVDKKDGDGPTAADKVADFFCKAVGFEGGK